MSVSMSRFSELYDSQQPRSLVLVSLWQQHAFWCAFWEEVEAELLFPLCRCYVANSRPIASHFPINKQSKGIDFLSGGRGGVIPKGQGDQWSLVDAASFSIVFGFGAPIPVPDTPYLAVFDFTSCPRTNMGQTNLEWKKIISYVYPSLPPKNSGWHICSPFYLSLQQTILGEAGWERERENENVTATKSTQQVL